MAAMDSLRLGVTPSAASTACLNWIFETQGDMASFSSASVSNIASDEVADL